jgi:hypothetical protein
MGKLSTTTLLLVVAMSSADAQACGEVMYRMGGAMRYHAFVTRHPAQILVYQGPVTRTMSSADAQNFHENLEKAGHKVTQVSSAEDLAKALASQHYDVVIAYAADVPTISDQISHLAPEPALIPVFSNGSDEHAVRQRYPLALNEDANLNQFLKTIEQTMKTRGT